MTLAKNQTYSRYMSPHVDKDSGVLIASSPSKAVANAAYERTGDLTTTGWLHVHTDIYNPANWNIWK